MKLSEWAARNGVHYQTAWAWAKAGRMPVPVRQTPSTWLVDEPAPEVSGRVVAYCRVSSADRKPDGEKIVFRIEDTSTAYFRALFGGIHQALRVDSAVPDESGGADGDRLHAQWEYRDYQGLEPPRSPATVLRSLVSPARAADAAAFDRVRKAEDAIKAALVPARGPEQQGIVINNSRVVVMSGAKVSENFYFQGTNTTFINRPKDTVVRDFQNTYGSATGGADLTQLLELVLSSRDLNDTQREEAAGAVHDLARAAAQPEPDVPAVRGRIERLRALMTGAGADIAQSALAILASLMGLFSG